MTPAQSYVRLALYVLTNMAAAAVAGINSVDFSDRKQVWIFALATIGVGLNTARSYIDKTPAEVTKP